jgi:general secretion pathway protein D
MNRNLIAFGIICVTLLNVGNMHRAVAQQINSSRAAESVYYEEEGVSMNFDKADILEVIEVMSRITGKNFIIDPAVKGQITVIAPARVPIDQAYEVFESILELNNFSLVPMGNIIKVVPSRAAKQRSIPVSTGREPIELFDRDQLITRLIPIKHTDAQAIVSVLSPLISQNANLTAYGNTNTIVLTETTSNIKRLLHIIQEIDVPGFEETITIIPLVNAQADILAQEILQAIEPGPTTTPRRPTPRTRRRTAQQPTIAGATSSQIKIIPDLRTNSLIVVANELDTEQIRFLVSELDQVTPVEANNIHVYRLENALAEEIAALLTNLAATTAAAGAKGAAATVSGVRTFYKEVSVVADKTTNSLLITATPQDYTVLKRVIEQLDVMRPQVLVETLIAEVSLDFTRDLGVKWLAANPRGKDHGFVGVNETTGDTLVENVAESLATGVPAVTNIPAGISVGYFHLDSEFLKAFIELNASEGNTDFNVLSAPHVLTLDNEKAVINISDNVPFITQRLSDTGGEASLATSETFEYRDVGIVLEITPHISPERMVRLEIVQKVNDVSVVPTGISAGALSEKKREAETTVVVKDRNTLVLGGLIKDSEDVTVNKVPFLGDIPVLGWVFKSKSVTRGKKNLLIFITPSIVTDVAEATKLTHERSDQAGKQLHDRMDETEVLRRLETVDESGAPSDPASDQEKSE